MEYLPYLTVTQQNLLLKPILRKRYYRGENINLPPEPPPERSPLATRLISPIPFDCEITAGLFPRDRIEPKVEQLTEQPDTPKSEASSFVYVKSDSDAEEDWDLVDDTEDTTEPRWSSLSKSRMRPSSSPSRDLQKTMATSRTLVSQHSQFSAAPPSSLCAVTQWPKKNHVGGAQQPTMHLSLVIYRTASPALLPDQQFFSIPL